MLYYILRPFVNFILKFFIKKITITGLENIPKSGALMLASTHANSFFDALLLCCLVVHRRVWSLARGDIFKKNGVKKLLASFFLIPVHRLSEGKEHMSDNDHTFNKCIELFKQGEVVLIFSEGLSAYQTKILPLKKGTARLAKKAQIDGIELTIIPITITYDSFANFGKTINLNIGTNIMEIDFPPTLDEGAFLKKFNEALAEKLNNLLNFNFPKVSFWQSPIFALLCISHFPAISLALFISRKLTKGSVFFDSVAAGLMVVLLPIYWSILLRAFVF